MSPKPKDVDQYIKSFPSGTQKMLQQIKTAVKKLAPDSEEVISYGIPAFKLSGKNLVYFAGWKEHVSMYPVPKGNKTLQKEISRYQTGKGTLQFSLDKPLPLKLITKIVKLRMKENLERAKQRRNLNF